MIILAPPKQKSVGTLPVVRPTLRGLRIAHLVETNNVEAHADMNILSLYRYLTSRYTQYAIPIVRNVDKHIPRASTVALSLTRFGVCEVPKSQVQSV